MKTRSVTEKYAADLEAVFVMSESSESAKRRNPYLQYDEPDSKRLSRAKNIDYGNDTTSPSTGKVLGAKTGISLHSTKKQQGQKFDNAKYIYGNYPNYYDNRRNKSSTSDPRMEVLDSSLFRNKRVLDIGCNSGNLTIAIAKWHLPQFIQGVDIDESLVAKAKTLLRTTYSLQKASDNDEHGTMDLSMRFHYFPRSMTYLHGFVPFDPSPSNLNTFPYNIEFRAGDWMDSEVKTDEYDTVLALSITKWIHLHRGDEGLKDFFRRIFKSLKPGGAFILEPQDFKTYHCRARQSEATQETFEHITFLPEQYESFLLNEVGFREAKELGTPSNDNKGFSRPLILYTK